MKIIGISGSPRHGNTEVLVQTALDEAHRIDGVETELVSLAGLDITPCRACDRCQETDATGCVIDDDLPPVLEKICEADGIIIGTPVHFQSVSCQVKTLMDRTNSLTAGGIYKLKNKVGGAIAVGGLRHGGQEFAIANILAFFLTHYMIVVGGEQSESRLGAKAWDGYELEPGAVQNDELGMKSAASIGWRVTDLVRKLNQR